MKKSLKIFWGILFFAVLTLPFWINRVLDFIEDKTPTDTQTVKIYTIDAVTYQELVPSKQKNGSKDMVDITKYLVIYQDSTGKQSDWTEVISPYQPSLGPAEIAIKNGKIVWYQKLTN